MHQSTHQHGPNRSAVMTCPDLCQAHKALRVPNPHSTSSSSEQQSPSQQLQLGDRLAVAADHCHTGHIGEVPCPYCCVCAAAVQAAGWLIHHKCQHRPGVACSISKAHSQSVLRVLSHVPRRHVHLPIKTTQFSKCGEHHLSWPLDLHLALLLNTTSHHNPKDRHDGAR